VRRALVVPVPADFWLRRLHNVMKAPCVEHIVRQQMYLTVLLCCSYSLLPSVATQIATFTPCVQNLSTCQRSVCTDRSFKKQPSLPHQTSGEHRPGSFLPYVSATRVWCSFASGDLEGWPMRTTFSLSFNFVFLQSNKKVNGPFCD
jgi:hypothetical protein